jgi:CHAT domain-containing protein
VQQLKNAQATISNVVHHIKSSPWIHLACHGQQDPNDPLKSAVLYTPPPVLADSVRTPQIRASSVWSPHGVHMDYTDHVSLLKKKKAWSPCGLRADLLKFTRKNTITLKY